MPEPTAAERAEHERIRAAVDRTRRVHVIIAELDQLRAEYDQLRAAVECAVDDLTTPAAVYAVNRDRVVDYLRAALDKLPG